MRTQTILAIVLGAAACFIAGFIVSGIMRDPDSAVAPVLVDAVPLDAPDAGNRPDCPAWTATSDASSAAMDAAATVPAPPPPAIAAPAVEHSPAPASATESAQMRRQDTILGPDVANSTEGAYILLARELDMAVFHLDDSGASASNMGKELLPIPRAAGPGVGHAARVAVVHFYAADPPNFAAVLPRLQRHFEVRPGTPGTVELVAVQTKAGDWRSKLPTGTRFLYEAGNGVSPLLARLEERSVVNAALPATLLLDCHRRVRWVHSGPLYADDLERKLQPAIDALVAEGDKAGACPVSNDGVCSSPGETCAPGVKDCYDRCHANQTCEAFAGERFSNPKFFSVCRHQIAPPSCRAEYHPTTHPWCHNDGKCTDADEQAEATGRATLKSPCDGDCAEFCRAAKRKKRYESRPLPPPIVNPGY